MNGFLLGLGVGVAASFLIFLLGTVYGSQQVALGLLTEVLADQAEAEAMQTAEPPLGIEP